jgi:hypothetical protein
MSNTQTHTSAPAADNAQAESLAPAVGRVAKLADGRERAIVAVNGQWAELFNEEKKIRLSQIVSVREPRSYNMSNHIRPYRAKYETTRNATGRKTKICGDDLSQALRTLLPNQAVRLAAKLLDRDDVLTKYESLNPGQQRMNSGNLLRNAIKRGDLELADVLNAIAGK